MNPRWVHVKIQNLSPSRFTLRPINPFNPLTLFQISQIDISISAVTIGRQVGELKEKGRIRQEEMERLANRSENPEVVSFKTMGSK